MATEKDIERLDNRIDKTNDRFDKIHDSLNESLTDIKTTLGRIDERLIAADGELEEGDAAFGKLDGRVSSIESVVNRWKGSIATAVVIGTVALNILYQGLKALYTYITTKGGGS